MSKNHVWVVEQKAGKHWYPVPHETSYDRGTARLRARCRREMGILSVRVRKYGVVGK